MRYFLLAIRVAKLDKVYRQQTCSHIGMWIILVNIPLGPSKHAGFMKPGEAFGTALLEFNNNVFHSNGQTGFFLDRKLLPDGTLDPTTLHYNPRVDPFDYKSDAKSQILFFKNENVPLSTNQTKLAIPKTEHFVLLLNRQHAWIRGGWIHVTKSSMSDAATGLTFARMGSAFKLRFYDVMYCSMGASKGEQFLTDSVIIGESINIGEPHTFYNRTSGKYRTMSRSYSRNVLLTLVIGLNLNFAVLMYVVVITKLHYPIEIDTSNSLCSRNWPVQGFVVYDGPVYVDNVWFDKFKRTDDYEMGAIGFLLNNKFASATVSTVTRAMFGFDDGPATGNRIFDGDATMFGFNNLDGDKLATVRDGDGSLTSFPGYQIVKPTEFYTTSECAVRKNWNMAYCPQKYGRIYFRLYSSSDLANAKVVVVRDDIPDTPEYIAGTKIIEVGMILGGTHSYTINFSGKIPRAFMLTGRGIDSGFPVRFGVCIPKGATFDLISYIPVRARELSEWKKLDSIEELDDDTVGGSFFYDSDVGTTDVVKGRNYYNFTLVFDKMLFLKFLSHKKRLNTTTTDCEGHCPYVQIKLQGGDVTQADCRQRVYPKYQRQQLASNLKTPADVKLPATSTKPPNLCTVPYNTTTLKLDKGLGAGSTKPFETRIQVAGGFGQWTKWGTCSSDCGGIDCFHIYNKQNHQEHTKTNKIRGIQFRKRLCDSPMPVNGGADCQGPRMEKQACNTQNCPIHGGFGLWGDWSECKDIVACKGYQERSRICDTPTPQFGVHLHFCLTNFLISV
ncbi:hypothetical protein KUTeg_018745 [Tegillarca granosa]|uniref:CEMIP domain-containing protein n=1 Tax=Tegillarca granosa TaxID=220873 RepID=A0ABQ9EJF4_TEGGR|nr:hypothetical protein KUTeg_018745 [Tegillarca granosa]